MASKAHAIADEAAQLERQERVAIIEKLLETLETQPAEDSGEVEKAWGIEVKGRSNDLKSSNVKSLPWNQVRAEGEKLFDGD